MNEGRNCPRHVEPAGLGASGEEGWEATPRPEGATEAPRAGQPRGLFGREAGLGTGAAGGGEAAIVARHHLAFSSSLPPGNDLAGASTGPPRPLKAQLCIF